MAPPDLPPPAVPATAYDERYYREACGDAAAFARGGPIGGVYAWALERLALRPGERLVDVGCGRGELVALARQRGVDAVGIEYSEDAVRLARDGGAEVLLADARALPLADRSADAVALLDVVEHLTAPELAACLAEVRRVLRPGGRVLVHTMPNRLLYDVVYRALRLAAGARWPADPRNEHERAMHVGEQSARSLRRALRAAGLREVRVRSGALVWDGFVPSARGRRWVHRLAAWPPTRALARADLIADARG